MDYFAPTERFIRRTVLFLLLAAALSGILATVLHLQQQNPHPLDLILPPALALIMLGLFVRLHRRPDSILQVIWIAVLSIIIGIAIPAWHYTVAAWRGAEGTLVGTLPPITSLLLPQILFLILFLRPTHLLTIAVGAWLVVAGPILLYLLTHPNELSTLRGMDMVITLGPVTLSIVGFIPLQRGVERWIAKLQRDRTQAQALAERDALTGLFNRRAGERSISSVLAMADANDVMLLLDIDHFKAINDTHGHPVGDSVLREVAKRCSQLLRKGDVFARWGGEEFLILIRGTDQTGAMRVANDLRQTISATPIGIAGTVTASFGVAHFRKSDTLPSWVARADRALYDAKSGGRNRVVEL